MCIRDSRSKHPFMVLLGNLLTMTVVLVTLAALVWLVIEESRARYKRKYPGTTDEDWF